ncbi:putative exonuclease V [Babesia sp. Xinjiang]|uniref:putative exonuclease V n=1 Tax=Babesia sp. Xinjiang TaxID=462227 RepID=UPI000A22DBD0|nr:putative exonuclease V [Babesia sp. Xinjiang]ORM42090.1 putative exonuclease V [Babesia sp. Xinjiang]
MAAMDNTEEEVRKHKTYRIAKKRSESKDVTISQQNDTTQAEDGNTNIEANDIEELIPDIEDYLDGALSTEATNAAIELPPVVKFRKNWSLSVTDLSAQLWCEKQIELVLITGRKRVTKEMEKGVERHEQLELDDHDIVQVEVHTNEDYLGIKLLNSINLIEQLMETGKCRELWLFGNFNGYIIRGIIDQLELIPAGSSGSKQVLISDTKTRNRKSKPSISQMQGASLQVQTYGIMLEKMRSDEEQFDALYAAFECDKNAPFVSEELTAEGCLATLEKRFRNAFTQLPEVANIMQLSYEYEGKVFNTSDIPLQKQSTMYTIQYLCDFWDGYREAQPVRKNEAWKCKMCEFKDECEVSPLFIPATKKNKADAGQLLLDNFLQKANTS